MKKPNVQKTEQKQPARTKRPVVAKHDKRLQYLTTYQAVIDNFNDLQVIAIGLMKTKTIVEWSSILKCSRTTIYAKQKDKGFTSAELSTIFKNIY